MKGHQLVKIPADCDDQSIIACLNLYGNLISYERISEKSVLFAYQHPLERPFPIIWCQDVRLTVGKATKTIIHQRIPPLIPWNIQNRVSIERLRFHYALEYLITDYPPDVPLEQLKLEIIVRFGHFVAIEFKKKFCFVYFDRLVRRTESVFCKIQMTLLSKRKYEEREVCLSCDAFNPVGFTRCTLCKVDREFCVYCNRENLPNHKFCGYCGKRVPFHWEPNL